MDHNNYCYCWIIQQRKVVVEYQVTWSIVNLTRYNETAKFNNQYAKI